MSTLPVEIINNGNETDPAVMHTIAFVNLVDAPLGLHQLRTVLTVIASNGLSWTLSWRTSDFVAIISAIILLTFAFDHYYLNSWYLVHIGGLTARRVRLGASTSQEKVTRNIESGKEPSNNTDGVPQPRKESLQEFIDSRLCCPSLQHYSISGLRRVALVARVVFEYPVLSDVPGWKPSWEQTASKPKATNLASSTPVEELSEKPADSPTGNCLIQFMHRHPWVYNALRAVALSIYGLFITFGFIWHAIFWPVIFLLYFLDQVAVEEAIYPQEDVRWTTPFLRCILRVAFWTVASVALLLQSSRMQATLWNAFRWTYAISWWLFWGALQSFSHVHWVFYWVGLPRIQLGNIYHVALMPSLITVYLYSGLVCDVVTLIMMVKKLWKSDGAN